MKIVIIGAGAMGCLYGGKLSAVPGNEVYLLDVWKDHIDAINQTGLMMEEKESELVYSVKAERDATKVGICDLAIIFVKSTLTDVAVRSNRAVFGPETVTLTLQNGLGNLELIAQEIGRENLLAGTTAHGALMLGPGRMRHTGFGKTVIGEIDGEKTERVARIVEVMEKAGLETDLSENVLGLVWDKLLVNVGINAITGITKLQNGQLVEYPEINDILERAVEEAVAVAKAKGIKLSFPDPVAHTRDVCVATAANKSSMLQDILNGKRTEIDMINGAIVREGKMVNIETPVNVVLTNLVRFMERQEN